MTDLTLAALKTEARLFVHDLGKRPIKELYGTTDGKAVGTYVEHGFHKHLLTKHTYATGNSASGIDFPELLVDLKVTSVKQPQSSCPFRDATQKVYGLGYHLLVFIYEKVDDHKTRTTKLVFPHSVFVAQEQTADYQTTYGLLQILTRNGNKDDVVAFLEERNLPLDEIGRDRLADEILKKPPELGYLTISNALQWRLQYGRAITVAEQGKTQGIENLNA